MGNRRKCCEEYHICFNHDSWYCDECKRNINMVDYLDIRVKPMHEGEFEKSCKDLTKEEMQESQKRLLYDDDGYLQKVYRKTLKEE